MRARKRPALLKPKKLLELANHTAMGIALEPLAFAFVLTRISAFGVMALIDHSVAPRAAMWAFEGTFAMMFGVDFDPHRVSPYSDNRRQLTTRRFRASGVACASRNGFYFIRLGCIKLHVEHDRPVTLLSRISSSAKPKGMTQRLFGVITAQSAKKKKKKKKLPRTPGPRPLTHTPPRAGGGGGPSCPPLPSGPRAHTPPSLLPRSGGGRRPSPPRPPPPAPAGPRSYLRSGLALPPPSSVPPHPSHILLPVGAASSPSSSLPSLSFK